MRLIRWDFSHWHRKPVPEKLSLARPCQGRVKFFALHPDDGGQYFMDEILEETTLEDLLSAGRPVWAASAILADKAVKASDDALDTAVDAYKASIVEVKGVSDVPRYTEEQVVYCPCGCGKVEYTATIDCTEFMVAYDVECPVCGEVYSTEHSECPVCGTTTGRRK